MRNLIPPQYEYMKTRFQYPQFVSEKPRNFSRKGFICTCLVPVFSANDTRKVLEFVKCTYKIKPTFGSKYKERGKITSVWGEYESLISVPEYIPNDCEISTGHFLRDGGKMPLVTCITIKDMDSYNREKLKIQRKAKIKKIKDNE